ncbi:MAG: efflux RND transporter periplasmic adaptor subunit [Colwellia sp.]|nr:efflux RND transporter periplasmic adaptor subunit [Colwellia sp.]
MKTIGVIFSSILLSNLVLSTVLLTASMFSISVYAEKFVTVQKAESLILFPARNASAQVVALNQSKIPAEISALLKKLRVNVGDEVQQGQLLAELDCYNTALLFSAAQAKAQLLSRQLAFAQRELNRGNKLAKQNNIGEVELDRRQTTIKEIQAQSLALESSYSLAKKNVSRCQINAPFAGIVTKRLVSEGEMLVMGQPVVELLQLDNLQVSGKISLNDQVSFLAANRYVFSVDKQSYPLSLRTLIPLVEKNTRSREARFDFEERSAVVGSSGRLTWLSSQAHLPAHLLQSRDGKNGFFILNGQNAQFIAVDSAEEGRPIPYTIEKNQILIIEGRLGLLDGEKVSLMKHNKVSNKLIANQ